MTASTVKSTRVSNNDSAPRTVNASGKDGGHLKVSVDSVEAATTSTDETGDVILMLPLDSHTRVHALRIYNDDLDSGGTSGAVDVGLYNGPEAFTTSAGTSYAAYAVIDADAFASAITTLTAANTAGVDVTHESGVSDIADAGEKLWEVAGLPEDPKRKFCVGITVTTAMTTPVAGTVTLKANHSD
jgi:hypothetical protein